MTTEKPFTSRQREPWNKGRMIGQKRPLKPEDVWTIRVRLQLEGRKRDLAMFNLAIDSKVRGCDLVRLRVDDVFAGGRVRDRATVIRKRSAGRFSLRSPNRLDYEGEIAIVLSKRGVDLMKPDQGDRGSSSETIGAGA